jgi:hypothetical protein
MNTDFSCVGSDERNGGEATGPRGPSERERASQPNQPQSVRDFNLILSTFRPLASASVSVPLNSQPSTSPRTPTFKYFQINICQPMPASAGGISRPLHHPLSCPLNYLQCNRVQPIPTPSTGVCQPETRNPKPETANGISHLIPPNPSIKNMVSGRPAVADRRFNAPRFWGIG